MKDRFFGMGGAGLASLVRKPEPVIEVRRLFSTWMNGRLMTMTTDVVRLTETEAQRLGYLR